MGKQAITLPFVGVYGNQNITGIKTFDGDTSIRTKSNWSLVDSTIPAVVMKNRIMLTDKYGVELGTLGSFKDVDGSVYIEILQRRQDDSSTAATKFRIGFDANKNEFCAASSGVRKSIVNWCMPSDKYVDVTASSGTYTAPADGYFQMSVNINDRIGFAWCGITASGLFHKTWGNEYTTDQFMFNIPVQKGAIVDYGLSRGTFDYVRFIFANGEI